MTGRRVVRRPVMTLSYGVVVDSVNVNVFA
jgi:hypothetical protein